MSDWLILVEHATDVAQHETPHKVLRVRDYLANPRLFTARRRAGKHGPKLVPKQVCQKGARGV